MPRIDITLRDISLNFEMDEEHAKNITRDDLFEMMNNALGVHHSGLGVQVIVKGKGQFYPKDSRESKDAVFANVFIDGSFGEDWEIDSCDDEYETLLADDPDICG